MAKPDQSTLTYKILAELWEKAACEFSGQGLFYCGDSSVPREATHVGRTWRCLRAPRLSVFLRGAHRLAYVRSQAGVESCLRKGDVLYLPSDAHDDEMFETSCQYLGVVFFENLTRFIHVTHETGQDAPLLGTPFFYHFHATRPASVNRLLKNLEELSTEKRPDPVIGRLLSHALWLEVLKWFSKDPHNHPTPGKAFATWLTIQDYLRENYHLPINRNTLGQALNLHSSRISALCREFAGSSFQELLEGKRLQRAKRFLSETDMKLETVAAMCGYNHVSYFIRVFRKQNGVTPGGWRLHNQKNIVPERALDS